MEYSMFDLKRKLEEKELTLIVYDFYQDVFGHKSWSAIWKFKGTVVCRIFFSDLEQSDVRLDAKDCKREVVSIYLDVINVLQKSPIYALSGRHKTFKGFKQRLLHLAKLVVAETIFMAKLPSLTDYIYMLDPTDISKIAKIHAKVTPENIKRALEQYPGLLLINPINFN